MEFKIGDYVNVKTAEGDVACKVVEECGASYYGVRNEQHMTIYTSSRFMTPLAQGAALESLKQAEAAEVAEAPAEKQYNEDVEEWVDVDEWEGESDEFEESDDDAEAEDSVEDAEETADEDDTEDEECVSQDEPEASPGIGIGTPRDNDCADIPEYHAAGGDCDPSGLTEIVDLSELGWQAILEGAPVRVVKLTKVDGIWFIHGKSIYTHNMIVTRLYNDADARTVLPYPFEP